MHLVVFDIDGTLTNTSQVDHACYWRALCEVFGIVAHQPDWSGFCHVTDLGIACEACERYLGRVANRQELDAVRQRLVALLEVALIVKDPRTFQIRGASAALALLRESPDFAIALATGGFRASAEVKLRRAGLFDASIPWASSDDAVAREQIMRVAAARAAEKYAVEFAAFTHVGDGVWDVKAARELGWNFIGVAAGEDAERLRCAGAVNIIADYEPVSGLLSMLRTPQRKV